ncbi:hypothetical protein [Emticicia soli]|uniref:Uncharacterized protein n=1 Tax=Emticicia soli TaxID=2027878 RepID=A0ABW5JB25_9BACT
MIKTINVFLYTCLSLTIFLIVIHIKKIDYYENPSKGIIENIYTGLTKISTHFSREDSLDYRLSLSFNHIQTQILVDKIEIYAEGIKSSQSNVLKIKKILPYSGMHNWNIPEFKKYSEIPSNLKILNLENNPYFAFDFILSSESNLELEKFKIKILLNFTENLISKNLDKELIILKKNKIQFKPLDNHSDGTLILLPFLIIISSVLAIFKFQYKRKQKKAKWE